MTWLLALGFLDDIWDFVQENGDELAGRPQAHAEGLGDRHGRRVRHRASSSAPRARTAIPVVSQLAAVYVEVIRNTPILVQIFMLYFALPQVGIRLDAFTVAWLSVTIWGGAFNTENFRAGFEAVPVRYREAGAALGFRASRRSSTSRSRSAAASRCRPRSTRTSASSRTRRSCTSSPTRS